MQKNTKFQKNHSYFLEPLMRKKKFKQHINEKYIKCEIIA